MDSKTIADFQAIVALQVSSFACLAEIEAMKITNKERELNGYSIAYDEEQFLRVSSDLKLIAEKLMQL